MHGAEADFDFITFQKFACFQIRHQDVTGLQTPAPDDMGRFLIQRARFRGEDQAVIIRQGAAHGAKAVPVEGCTDHVAIAV